MNRLAVHLLIQSDGSCMSSKTNQCGFHGNHQLFQPAGKDKDGGQWYMGDVYGPGMEVAHDTSCTFPWLEFCHMDTPYCKGIWERYST